MLKEAIEKIVSLAENKTYKIDGKTYSDHELYLVKEPADSPRIIRVNSLNSIVHLIKNEIARVNASTLFVQVENYNHVNVFTTYRNDFSRYYLYEAVSDTPNFSFGWKDYESAIIDFRSQFEQTEDIDYLLNLLSRITDEKSVASEDNGLSQKVEVRKGIALIQKENVRSRVALKPFRTFLEVEQPLSEFLVRLSEGGQVGLFEADGGMWKLTAKKAIYDYLEKWLKDLISDGQITLMM